MKKLLKFLHKKGSSFLFDIFGHKSYEKFAIITRSRTGSSLLVDLLNSHPNIESQGERFTRLGNKTCEQVWNEIFGKKAASILIVGFKIFYYHPQDSDDKKVWKFLFYDKNIRIIHLKRRNLLRTILSRAIAEKTDIWSSRSTTSKVKLANKKVLLNANDCFREFERIKKWEVDTDKKFSSHQIFNLNYEDLILSNEGLKEVQKFLGVPYKDLNTKFKKLNKENLEELIENYEELVADFKGTKWDYLIYLEERST